MPKPDDAAARIAGYHLGAEVHSADGRHIGSLHRVIVNRETWEPVEVVVQETRRFSGHTLAPGTALLTDDIIVPLSAVARADRARIDLSLSSAEVRRLPPYLSYGYAPLTTGEELVDELSVLTWPSVRPLVETAAKAVDEIEIRADESVMLGHTGRLLGRVRDVILDEGELAGIVLRPSGFFKHDVVLQARFLERSDDAVLFAKLTDEDLEHLEPFEPAG
jgi:sporulation protein YlmC with PRC-barrel domain